MPVQNQSVLYRNKTNNHSTVKLFDSIHRGEGYYSGGGEEVVTIQGFLQEGADIDARDSKGYTPLMLACVYGQNKIVDLLIEAGANFDVTSTDDQYTALHCASYYAWTKIVRTLVKKVLDLNVRDVKGETPLHHASRCGRPKVVQCLLEEGADINVENFANFTPLLCAAERSWVDGVDLLLNVGASVAGYEDMLLFYASRNGWTKLVHFLVKICPGLNKCVAEFDKTALHAASICGRLEVVKCLVKNGAEINNRNSISQTALNYASWYGHLETVKWLLENGADTNVKNRYGAPSVLQAARSGSKDVVDLLVHYGTEVNATDHNKNTMLHYVTQQGWKDTVQSIIKRNCDLNARNGRGFTALGVACMNEKFYIAQCLLQAGARWDVEDNDGSSPLNYVTTKIEPELKFIKLLIESGAYLKPADYQAIARSRSSLKVLQDVKLCCQALINKFNNHDLPELYKLPASGSLPRIEEMKIARGSNVARAIEQSVGFEIQTKGHCNILKVHPMGLNIFSVKSVLEYFGKRKSNVQSRLKRLAAFDPSNKCKYFSEVKHKKQCMSIVSSKMQ